MGLLAYDPIEAVITVGGDTAGVFPVAIQLNGSNGKALTHVAAIHAYLSKSADGSDISAYGTDTSEFVIGTDGLFVEHITDIAGLLVSEADGDIDVEITVVTTKSAYLVLVMPDGRLVISDLMTYTA